MSKKNLTELEKKWKQLEQGEMEEEVHQIELKNEYEQDEKYNTSED
jgi:hypothetical protein